MQRLGMSSDKAEDGDDTHGLSRRGIFKVVDSHLLLWDIVDMYVMKIHRRVEVPISHAVGMALVLVG
jgi:hypothetical protein